MKMSKGFMLFMACLGLVGVTGAVVASSSIGDNIVFAQNGTQTISCYDELNGSITPVNHDKVVYGDWTLGRYQGNSADNGSGALQMRASKNSGIITLTSPGKLRKVELTWNSSTYGDRQIDVYGKNTAYTATSELYNAETQGELIGSIALGGSTTLTVSDDYNYIGFRSKNGALYIDSIKLYYNK